MCPVRPYPFASLPRRSREDVARIDALAALAEPEELERMIGAARALLEVEIGIAPGPLGVVAEPERSLALAPTLVAVAIEHPAARLALELEPQVSLAIVDRVLGGEGAAAPGPALLSPVERGVLAFVAARLSEGEARVLDVLTTREGLAAWLGEPPSTFWSCDARFGSTASRLRLWVSGRAPLARARRATRALAPWLLDVATTMRVVVGRARLDAGQLGALAVGDVLLPDELLAARSEGEPRWSAVRLVSRGGELFAELVPDDEGFRCALRGAGGAGARASVLEETMSEDDEEAEWLEAGDVAEVPVEVSIELGRLELRVRELAALVPGRIVSARIPVGGEVELRAGDRLLAKGALVDVEGELGVQLTRVYR